MKNQLKNNKKYRNQATFKKIRNRQTKRWRAKNRKSKYLNNIKNDHL